MGEDAPPAHLTQQNRWGNWVMRRLDDGWCAAVDRVTMLCRIYPVRPNVCRSFEVGESDCLDIRARHGIDPAPDGDVGPVG